MATISVDIGRIPIALFCINERPSGFARWEWESVVWLVATRRNGSRLIKIINSMTTLINFQRFFFSFVLLVRGFQLICMRCDSMELKMCKSIVDVSVICDLCGANWPWEASHEIGEIMWWKRKQKQEALQRISNVIITRISVCQFPRPPVLPKKEISIKIGSKPNDK